MIRDCPEDKAKVSNIAVVEVKTVGFGTFTAASQQAGTGRERRERRLFVCRACGNIVLDKPPEKCPICGADKRQFKETR